MNRLILATVLISSTHAMADKYKLIYLDAKGRQVSAEEGILKAAGGEEVLKCQTVEAKVSKSGTSISLKNIKKPKTKEAIDEQIKELEKQKEN